MTITGKNQSYKNWELLIVNEESTNQSSKIANDYAKRILG